MSARSSETSVNFYQTTQRLISQDGNLEVVPLVLNSEEVTVITVELGEEVFILLQVENKKRDNQLKLIRRRTYRNSVLVVFLLFRIWEESFSNLSNDTHHHD